MRYYADDKGRIAVGVKVHRVITVKHRAFDCGSRPKRCLIVAADASTFDRSGGLPLSFAKPLAPVPLVDPGPGPHSTHQPIGGLPVGPFRGPTRVTVVAQGFQPGEPVVLARCQDTLDEVGFDDACDPVNGPALPAGFRRDGPPEVVIRATADGLVKESVMATTSVADYVSFFDQPAPTGERTSCTTKPGRCAIVVAAEADTKRSAVLPYEIGQP